MVEYRRREGAVEWFGHTSGGKRLYQIKVRVAGVRMVGRGHMSTGGIGGMKSETSAGLWVVVLPVARGR